MLTCCIWGTGAVLVADVVAAIEEVVAELILTVLETVSLVTDVETTGA